MKFVVNGIETVCDVIEADNRHDAEVFFFAKYPAVNKITKIETFEATLLDDRLSARSASTV